MRIRLPVDRTEISEFPYQWGHTTIIRLITNIDRELVIHWTVRESLSKLKLLLLLLLVLRRVVDFQRLFLMEKFAKMKMSWGQVNLHETGQLICSENFLPLNWYDTHMLFWMPIQNLLGLNSIEDNLRLSSLWNLATQFFIFYRSTSNFSSYNIIQDFLTCLSHTHTLKLLLNSFSYNNSFIITLPINRPPGILIKRFNFSPLFYRMTSMSFNLNQDEFSGYLAISNYTVRVPKLCIIQEPRILIF